MVCVQKGRNCGLPEPVESQGGGWKEGGRASSTLQARHKERYKNQNPSGFHANHEAAVWLQAHHFLIFGHWHTQVKHGSLILETPKTTMKQDERLKSIIYDNEHQPVTSKGGQ